MVGYGDGKEKDLKYTCVSVSSTDDSPPETPVTPRVKTWGNDSIKEEGRRWEWSSRARWKVRWTWALHEAWLCVWHAMKWTTRFILHIPIWQYVRRSKKQCFALFLVLATAFAPLVILGYFSSPSYYGTPFVGLFRDKVLGCGDNLLGNPQNATVTGIEKLFALDQTFGKFSFSQVKTIDILWDLLVGRGLQLLAWWAAYTVFSDALLRAIERHPTSFNIFQRIALEGPGLGSLWTLTRELWVAKSRRTKALFLYMFWSTAYVLFVPIVLGAMTGYDSTSIAWIDLDGNNNIVPASILQRTWVISGTVNTTFSYGECVKEELQGEYRWVQNGRESNCDCKLSNGTMITAEDQGNRLHGSYSYDYKKPYENCAYDYANNTQTWGGLDYSTGDKKIYNCNSTITVQLDPQIYPDPFDAQYLKGDSGWCYNKIGYDYSFLYDKSRCLPDTADPTYQWGFSSLMSGLFVMFTSAWVLSMYAVWQDAQFNSTLVKEGYKMTPLRAAFAMAKAAKRRTGLGEKQLVRANTKDLEKELYGGRGKRKTKIEYDMFVHDPEGGDEEPRRSPGVSTLDLKSPVLSDGDSYVQVISDEELRRRYMRGVAEARLSRKPLASEAERYTPKVLKRRTTEPLATEAERLPPKQSEKRATNNDITTTIHDGEKVRTVLKRRTTGM